MNEQEIDRRVAVEVMGINPRSVRVRGSNEFVTIYSLSPYWTDGNHFAEELLREADARAYSTDWVAAWDAIEKMIEMGFQFELKTTGFDDEPWGCSFENHRVGIVFKTAKTATMAICLASLEAQRLSAREGS